MYEAILKKGMPFILTHTNRKPGQWYKQKQYSEGNDCYGKPGGNAGTPGAQQCDEYPFGSALQGGPKRWPRVSLRMINADHNNNGGPSTLQRFQERCLGGNQGVGKKYLVLPLPGVKAGALNSPLNYVYRTQSMALCR